MDPRKLQFTLHAALSYDNLLSCNNDKKLSCNTDVTMSDEKERHYLLSESSVSHTLTNWANLPFAIWLNCWNALSLCKCWHINKQVHQQHSLTRLDPLGCFLWKFQTAGELAQMLCTREVVGSMPTFSKSTLFYGSKKTPVHTSCSLVLRQPTVM